MDGEGSESQSLGGDMAEGMWVSCFFGNVFFWEGRGHNVST